MNRPIIVYGATELSRMLYYDAAGDPDFTIAAFTTDDKYLLSDSFVGLPLVSINKVKSLYPPSQYDMIAVVGGYADMRGHTRYYSLGKQLGYRLRTYLSKRSFISPGARFGENSIVLSFSYVGADCAIAENVIIRQNCYLGHHVVIEPHSFIGVECNIGGETAIGELSYLAMGSIIIDRVKIGRETLVGAGSVVLSDTDPYVKVVGNPARVIGSHEAEGIRIKKNE